MSILYVVSQERQRLKGELTDVKRRLDSAEKQLVESKEQCIHLTTQNQGLERDVHLAKISKESIEKNRSDDVRMIQRRSDQREIELNDTINSMESRHGEDIRSATCFSPTLIHDTFDCVLSWRLICLVIF